MGGIGSPVRLHDLQKVIQPEISLRFRFVLRVRSEDDNIQSAAFQNPGLTTLGQPLRKMGERAAETVLKRIDAPRGRHRKVIMVAPELVVRGSTAAAAKRTTSPE
jgi:hypothetical protein